MQYKPFGRTGREASILGFGAMRLPTHPDGNADYDQAVPILRAGLDAGINFIDTAHLYLNGTSEIAVGKAIQGLDRSTVTIETKVAVRSEEQAGADAWRRTFDLSLERLGTYVDIMLFHGFFWDFFNTHLRGPNNALTAARKAQSEGLIKHIGFSSHDAPDNIIKLIDSGEFESLLVQYNYLYRHNAPVLAHAVEKGLGTVVMGPLAGGRLARPEGIVVDEPSQRVVKGSQVALRFVWDNPNVGVAISGMENHADVDENIALAEQIGRSTDADALPVRAFLAGKQAQADAYCNLCGECLPCPQNVNIPENFRYMNWLRVWGLEEEARRNYANLGKEGVWVPWVSGGYVYGLRATACNDCGECLPRCPQRVPIIAQLHEVARTLA